MDSVNNKIVAIYIRVSTDAQAEEGYSIEAQKEQLTAYCIAKKWKKYDYYIDGGYSGSTLDRPEIKRLIQDAKNNKISTCIVFKLDRLSRSQKDTLFLIEDIFNKYNVDFVSLNESIDTSTPTGRMMIGILSAFAQLERENIKLRTRMGMKERVKSGLWMGGGRVPFGYDYDDQKGVLVPNKDAETVKKIYDLYLQGFSTQKIADIVGLKYDKLASQILTRKINYGIIEYNGVEYVGKHEPIITKDIYDKAMAMMKKRQINNIIPSVHLLTGLVYCGKCGAKMQYRNWGKKGYKLVCYSQQISKPYLRKDENCNQDKMWADEIEDIVINDIKKFSLDFKPENDIEIKESVIEILIQKQTILKKKIKNLFNLYSESEDSLLLETINENKKELEKVTQQIILEQEKENQTIEKSELKKTLDSLNEMWDYLSLSEQQNIIRIIVEKITITDQNIEINYRL